MRSLKIKTTPGMWDLLPAAAVIVLIWVLMVCVRAGAVTGLTAVVSVDGYEVERVSLHGETERTYTAGGCTLTVTFCPEGETGVQVTASDCPNRDCVRAGCITRAGQSIVCLPAKFVIELVGGTESGVDAVIG